MRRPLVVLTTAAGSLSGLADVLRKEGLDVRETPLLTFGPPPDWTRVDAAMLRLPEFRAVAFTSPRAAQAFAERVTAPMHVDAWATCEASAAALQTMMANVRMPSSLATMDAGAGSLLASAMLAGRVG